MKRRVISAVVLVVPDQQFKSIPDPRHLPVGALVGGHRDRSKLVDAIAEAADGVLVHRADLAEPLVEQHARRNQAQRRETGPGHRGQRQARLSTPGGQHNNAAPARQLPGTECRLLVWSQLDRPPAVPRRRHGTDLVGARRCGAREDVHQLGVPPRRRTPGSSARIPHEPRNARCVRAHRRIEQEESAAIEYQTHVQ